MARSLKTLIVTATVAANLAAQQKAPSADKMQALSAAISEQLDRRDSRVKNEAIKHYVQDLSDRISRSEHAYEREIRVTLSSRRYAMLLPNNILYLSAGMVLMTQNESELAALLAHEQFHEPSWYGQFVMLPPCVLFSEWMRLGSARSLREREMRANVLAVEALKAAGYDPSSLFTLLSRLASQQPVWKSSLATEQFLSNVSVPLGGYVIDTSRHLALRESLSNLMRQTLSRSPSLLKN